MTGQLYRVWCRYEPDHVNEPAGRRGQWRVMQCYEFCGHGFILRYTPGHNVKNRHQLREIGIPSTKRYPVGSIIRPHKELNRVLAARKAS